jgi:hypothetical protein
MSDMSIAMQRLQEAAMQTTQSFVKVAAMMQDFAALAKGVTFMPGDASHKYKTLDPKSQARISAR